jgi:cytochrome bd-type quinol oxidase subunit 2
MPDLHPAPVAEEIDEPAARRSIRLTLIIVSAALLLPMLGIFLYVQFGHRPAGVHHSNSGWPLVIILAVMGIMVVAMLLLVRRQYRRPGYRRVMQYGWRRRSRVGKDMRRGRTLSPEDMPVAAAMVDSMRSQRRWLVILIVLMPASFAINGLNHHGFLRWVFFGFAAYSVALYPFLLRQQRQMIRNYERQNIPTVDGHQHDAASGTAG